MPKTWITINGERYDSPEAMPPDVRRTYEEAMRKLGPALATGQSGETSQVIRHEGLGPRVIVKRTFTVNGRTYGGLDELPPEVRQQFEDALRGAAPTIRPKTSLHVSLNAAGHEVQNLGPGGKLATPVPMPLEPSSLESRIRDIPVSLAILAIIGLILWAFLR